MKKPLTCLTLIILIMSSLSACAQAEQGNKPSAEIWQLEGHWRYSPQSVWGDTLVAGEYIGNRLEAQYISAYDLQTRETRRLTEIPLDYRFEEPSIYEDRVVWSSAYYSKEARESQQKDFEALNWDVFLLDLKTGEVRQITSEEHAQTRARIYGDTIVWLDNRNEEDEEYPHYYDVYAYDLKTGEERRITTTNSIKERHLGIDGSLVVWTDSRNDDASSRIRTHPPVTNNDIYLFDLSTNQERQITADVGNDSYPVIDDSRIVWIRSREGREADIFLYDVNTGQEVQISNSGYAAHDYYPAISGDRVVWADARISRGNTAGDVIEGDKSGAAEIYLYDLGSQQERLLVPSEGTEFTLGQSRRFTNRQVWLNPVMQGDFVIYTLSRQVGSAAYALRLDER
ncbi:MAG: hypothetical protein HYX84_08470 [Chloroflexi bacterium]|nr:hypothetical protein [Chloroflexota bacterium]